MIPNAAYLSATGSHPSAMEEGLGVRENKAEGTQLLPEPPGEHLRLETIQSLGLYRSHFSRDPMLVSMCEMISELMDVPIVGENSNLRSITDIAW